MTAIATLDLGPVRAAWLRFLRGALNASESAVTPWAVVLNATDDTQRSNAPRPELPYVTLRLDGLAQVADVVEERIVVGNTNGQTGITTNNVEYRGERTFTAMLQFFGVGATAYADAVRMALGEPERRAVLWEAGVFPRDIGAVRNLTTLIGTAWEGRAALDVICGIAGTVVTSPGTIDTVTGTMTVEAENDIFTEPLAAEVG